MPRTTAWQISLAPPGSVGKEFRKSKQTAYTTLILICLLMNTHKYFTNILTQVKTLKFHCGRKNGCAHLFVPSQNLFDKIRFSPTVESNHFASEVMRSKLEDRSFFASALEE